MDNFKRQSHVHLFGEQTAVQASIQAGKVHHLASEFYCWILLSICCFGSRVVSQSVCTVAVQLSITLCFDFGVEIFVPPICTSWHFRIQFAQESSIEYWSSDCPLMPDVVGKMVILSPQQQQQQQQQQEETPQQQTCSFLTLSCVLSQINNHDKHVETNVSAVAPRHTKSAS